MSRMPSLRRSETIALPVEELSARAAALSSALTTGGDRLAPTPAARAREVVGKVSERTALVGGHTVVALAGATGSGKSSLFNTLVGADVARVGMRRPTTSTPTAAVWGDEPAGELLDWPEDPGAKREQVAAFAEFARLALRRRISLLAATTYDIEWNGPDQSAI